MTKSPRSGAARPAPRTPKKVKVRRAAKPCSPPWFVYVLRCADGTLYTGVALDVRLRLAQHETGRGARYTRGRGPLELCAVRRCKTRGDALRLEHAVKQLTRARKEWLLLGRRLGAFARATASAERRASRQPGSRAGRRKPELQQLHAEQLIGQVSRIG